MDVVEQVRSGALTRKAPDANLIKLRGWNSLSLGGNEIVVHQAAEGPYVLFFTFRGVLGHYSGFLYVPEGGSPESYANSNGDRFIEVTPLEPHWYFVAAA